MTAVLERTPTRPVDAPPGTRVQLWARGSLAALSTVAVAAAVLLVLVLVAWAADPRSTATAGDASRLGLALLALACRVPLHVTGGSVAIPPLGLTLLVGFTLYRAAGTLIGWWAGTDVVDLREIRGRRGGPARAVELPPPAGLRQVLEVVAAVAVPFAVLITVLSATTGDAAVQPVTYFAPFSALGVGIVAAGLGALRRGRCWASLVEPLPVAARDGLVGAGCALAVLLATATLVVLGSLGVHGGRLMAYAHPPGGGVVGSVVVLLASLLLLPNAAVAALGYLTGAGLSVGTGTVVSAGGVHVAHVPAVPLLAAVPDGAAPIGVRIFLFAAVGGAGVAAALLPRRGPGSMLAAATRAGVASALTALLVGLAVAWAGGPAGPRALATVGGSGWRTGLLLLAEMGTAALLVAVGRAGWATWSATRE